MLHFSNFCVTSSFFFQKDKACFMWVIWSRAACENMTMLARYIRASWQFIGDGTASATGENDSRAFFNRKIICTNLYRPLWERNAVILRTISSTSTCQLLVLSFWVENKACSLWRAKHWCVEGVAYKSRWITAFDFGLSTQYRSDPTLLVQAVSTQRILFWAALMTFKKSGLCFLVSSNYLDFGPVRYGVEHIG